LKIEGNNIKNLRNYQHTKTADD